MNKQQEIREGLALRIHTVERTIFKMVKETSPCNCSWEELEQRFKDNYYMMADDFRRYLHSQGVVVKVEKALPYTDMEKLLDDWGFISIDNNGMRHRTIPICLPPPTKEYPRTKLHLEGEYLATCLKTELRAQEQMQDAGFTATEPLIEEK